MITFKHCCGLSALYIYYSDYSTVYIPTNFFFYLWSTVTIFMYSITYFGHYGAFDEDEMKTKYTDYYFSHCDKNYAEHVSLSCTVFKFGTLPSLPNIFPHL